MIERQNSGGGRQKAWDRLAKGPAESVRALGQELGVSENGLRSYIAALVDRGYIAREVDGSLTMIRHTGPRSPSYSVHTDQFRDWNIEPAMSATEFARLLQASGLSVNDWLRAAGMRIENSTRIRQMKNGQRPVSSIMAEAAKRLATSHSARP